MKNLKTIIAAVLLATSLISCSSEDEIIEPEVYKPVKILPEHYFNGTVDIVEKYLEIIKSVGGAVEYNYSTYIDDNDLHYDAFFDGIRFDYIKSNYYAKASIFFYKKFLGNRYLVLKVIGEDGYIYRKVFKIEYGENTVDDLLTEMSLKIGVFLF